MEAAVPHALSISVEFVVDGMVARTIRWLGWHNPMAGASWPGDGDAVWPAAVKEGACKGVCSGP